MKISIIVPIYNVEKYLKRCIDSILAQNYTDFELLLIDDGSTDKSGNLCDEYKLKDARIRVFHKENGGVSTARNLGLQNASGEWITFVDSDDYIENDYLYKLYKNLSTSELVVSAYIYESTKENVIEKLSNENIIISSGNLNDLLMRGAFMTPICKLFSRDIITNNNIKFDDKIHSGEDTLFVYTYLYYVTNVTTIENVLYHYCITGSGLSTKVLKLNEYNYMLDSFYERLKYFEEKYVDYDMSLRYVYIVFEIFLKLINNSNSYSRNFFVRKKTYKKILESKHFNYLLKDHKVLSKGVKRKIFDFLALKKQYSLLTIYSYYYDYK